MLPAPDNLPPQGRHFIEQAERVLREVDRLDRGVQEEQERCAELRVIDVYKRQVLEKIIKAGENVW